MNNQLHKYLMEEPRDLNISERFTMTVLAYRSQNSHCHPSTKALAEQVGLSTKQIKRILKSLEAKGYIRFEPPSRPNAPRIIEVMIPQSLPTVPEQNNVPPSPDTTHVRPRITIISEKKHQLYCREAGCTYEARFDDNYCLRHHMQYNPSVRSRA